MASWCDKKEQNRLHRRLVCFFLQRHQVHSRLHQYKKFFFIFQSRRLQPRETCV
jgi:hypothetical protein